MEESAQNEQSGSVRDRIRKLQTNANDSPTGLRENTPRTPTTPSATPTSPFGIVFSQSQSQSQAQSQSPQTLRVDTGSEPPAEGDRNFSRLGSIRQKLSELNGASQDWRNRVRSENDAVQFTAEHKMRTRKEQPSVTSPTISFTVSSDSAKPQPQRLLDHSVSCTEPTIVIREEGEAEQESSTDVFPNSSATLPEQRSETIKDYRLRMRPRRAHMSSRAQKAASACHASDELQPVIAVSKQPSATNLSIEVDRPVEIAEPADALLNRADRAVKSALSTKINFEEETARRKRSEPRSDNDRDADSGLLFGSPSTLRADTDWCALLVKGKRRVQVRLVQPDTSTFSGSDSYVVVTRAAVFTILGAFSNVLERSRASDVAKLVTVRRELGYTNAEEVNAVSIEQRDLLLPEIAFFWTAVGAKPHDLIEPVDDDETYENSCHRETVIFEVESYDDGRASKTQLRLRPLLAAADTTNESVDSNGNTIRAGQLSSTLLDSRKALLFQFGAAETYLWFGKHFDFRLRNAALHLASNYIRECVSKPPSFALIAKVNEGAEPTIFVQKFAEWLRRDGPASSMIQRAESDRSKAGTRGATVKRTESDVNEDRERGEPPRLQLDDNFLRRMVDARVGSSPPPSSFVLNGDELRRGATWIEVQDEGVIKRLHDVTTLGVTLWLVDAKTMKLSQVRTVNFESDAATSPDSHEVSSNSGSWHLFEQNSYILRWQFRLDGRILTQRGGLSWPHGHMLPTAADRQSRDREKDVNSHSPNSSTSEAEDAASGRTCSSHFIWHGCSASSQTRTAAAYLLCALDADKTPHRVVEQFREPPAFLRLLNAVRPATTGCVSVLCQHRGSHDGDVFSASRLFVLRHDFAAERVFVEIDCSSELLHSDACYLLVRSGMRASSSSASILYWDAQDSPIDVKQRAELTDYMRQVANTLVSERPKEVFGEACVSPPVFQKCALWREFVDRVRHESTADGLGVCDQQVALLKYDPQARLRLFRFAFTGVQAPSEFGPLNFDLIELHSPLRRDEYASQESEPRYPFTQADLHDAARQADTVLLIDAFQHCVFVWFSPDTSTLDTVDESTDADLPLHATSVGSLWNEYMRVAMQTALAYCDRLVAAKGYLLFSGLEPAAFRNLFPFWTPDLSARRLNSALLATSSDCFAIDLQAAYDCLFNRRHSTVELRERKSAHAQNASTGLPLRVIVDSRYLEAYLTDEEFESEFKMPRKQFYLLPRWRQTALKKDLNLL